MNYDKKYTKFQIDNPQDSQNLINALSDVEAMTLKVIGAIVDRCDKNEDYPFIDTKLSLIDGKNFCDKDSIRGKDTIYSWIQGRGLEAFVAHEKWLQDRGDEFAPICDHLKAIVARVFEQTEKMRANNSGRLFFMMSRDGEPRRMGTDGQAEKFDFDTSSPVNFSDLFYCKGMIAAADLLGDDEKKNQACQWFERICEDIFNGRFATDQQPLDPKNLAIAQIPGRIAQGPYMIALGAAACFVQYTGDEKFAHIGFKLIDRILDKHVNVDGRNPELEPFDMWEFIDTNDNPFVSDGKILSDPGHCTEFVGLAMKFIDECIDKGLVNETDDAVKECYRVLPEILIRNFKNGYAQKGFGIVKSINLLNREILNTDMPWWSLPETMRSAVLCSKLGGYKKEMRVIFAKCFNAFNSHYVKPELNLMAVQTLDENGAVATAIPATPDADPAYHTGMSLIDCLINENLIV